MTADDALLAEQVRYYRERAPEYEDWWYRRHDYDRGLADNARWFADVAEVEAAFDRAGLDGDMLELACGTGIWTRRLAAVARRVTAVDASAETLEQNRTSLPPGSPVLAPQESLD